MPPAAVFRSTLCLLVLLLGSSCAEFEQAWNTTRKTMNDVARTAAAAPHARPAYWNADGVSGSPRIVINLSEQRAYFYKGKRVVGETNISTGRKGFETPPGRYRVIQKDADHVSNLYGNYINEDDEVIQRDVDVTKDPMPDGTEFRGAPMRYFLRFTKGYGMHAGFVPRYRASHGCIRIPGEMAKRFFEAAELGTPVVVER